MLGNVFLHLHPVKTRKSGVKMRYTWCAGGVTFFLFLVLTFTGLLLMFYYRPTVEYAFVDILDLREQVPFGIMREMHRWGAHAMVISVWIHMFRVFMTGSYKPPAGVQLGHRRDPARPDPAALLHRLPAALGPAGDLGHHGRLEHGLRDAAHRHPGAGHGLLKIGDIPLVTSTNDARFGLLGGRFVGAGALLRFYVLHCVGIPLVAAFLMAVHFWRVRKDGGISGPVVDAWSSSTSSRAVVNFLSAPQYLVTASLILSRPRASTGGRLDQEGRVVLLAVGTGAIGALVSRPELPQGRDPARQRADRRDDLPRRLLLLVRDEPGLRERPADRGRASRRSRRRTRQQKVFSWPDLVYIELICLVIVMAVMIVWSIYLKAPLEEPANPTDTPNPTKAPWYFLGLQEMLVYFDPWLAGVVLPSLIIVGLMAIPYIDTTQGERLLHVQGARWEITFFLFGFLVLWCVLIVLGTFLRGPNWNFFGPYEFWDIHKLVPLNNINLSEIIWVKLLKRSLPNIWLVREIFGLVARRLLRRRAAARCSRRRCCGGSS